MAGLTAAGQITSYVMTKHAVVGLSLALRSEAAAHGVDVAYDPDRLARDTLRAIERNRALLVKPRRAHAQWVFARLAPGLMQRMSIRFIAAQRASQAHARAATR